MSSGCDKFHSSSRAFKSCCESNAFREMHGLAPIEGLDETPLVVVQERPITKPASRPVVTLQTAPATFKRGCGSCGGSRPVQPPNIAGNVITSMPMVRRAKPPKTPEGGPGTRLLELFAGYGFPHCDQCLKLAARMDDWGRDGCRKHFDLIVADILPRALAWEADKLGWFSRLIPEGVTEAGIRLMVTKAIDSLDNRTARSATAAEFRLRPFTDEPTRHLIYHVYSHSANGVWRVNLDHLRQRLDLFNGRRLVAIATGPETEPAAAVREYLAGYDCEFTEYNNDNRKQEMVSFRDQLSALQTNDPNAVVFRAHAKGVTHTKHAKRFNGRRKEEFDSTHMPALVRTLYETNLDHWETVRAALEWNVLAGSFKIYDAFRDTAYRWAFAGSFYWFRADEIYRRNWTRVGHKFYGVESWPGHVAQPHEAACLFCDHATSFGELNKSSYWRRVVVPLLEAYHARQERWTGQPRLSILMPTVRPTLARSLASLAPQLSADDEVLLLPDGPAYFEQTRTIAEASGIPNWRMIESGPFNNLGHGQINHALPLATKDAIAFLDDDDIYTPNAIAAMREGLAKHPGRPLLFRMRSYWDKLIWSEPKIEYGNIGSPCIVLPNDQQRLGRWWNGRGADFEFLRQTLTKYPPESHVFCDSVVCECRPKS